mmetsp:Transcript_104399/g.196524  ORF Transcript_104399/g.196524 Transcript_104399/m.196524 type:complete len:529 (+) Transcript_104399:68-1654(+)
MRTTHTPHMSRLPAAPRQYQPMYGVCSPRQHRPMQHRPMSTRAVKRAPSATTRLQPRSQEDEELELCGTGFTCREVGTRAVQAWVAFQAVSFLFQLSLWREVGNHLDAYSRTLDTQCPPGSGRREQVCLGPMWNLSSSQNLALEGRHTDAFIHHSHHKFRGRSHFHEMEPELHWNRSNQTENPNASRTFEFTIRSVPSTFLVAVEPVSRAAQVNETPPEAPPNNSEEALHVEENSAWMLKVERVDPPQTTRSFVRSQSGSAALTFEDLSDEAEKTLAQKGRVLWRATLQNRGYSRRQTRFSVFVEDSAIPHLADIHSSSQCSFARSWRAFNQQHQGRSHEYLALSRALLGLFLPINAAVVVLVGYFFQKEVGFCFHTIVMFKFFLVDVPQQACVVLYLLGWYEAEGLRCQLCLFHPQHCEEEHPFRLANSIAFACTVLSGLVNQLIIRPVWKRHYTEEDECLQVFVRIGMASVSILPFTTGVYYTTSALLYSPVAAQVFFFVPCCMGWFTVALVLFCWVYACCSDCDK